MQTLQTFEELWARKPGHRGFVRFAQALAREGQTDRAVQVLKDGVQKWPKDLAAHLLLSSIAGEKGDGTLQRTSLENAVAADPRSPAALWSLGSLLASHQYFQQSRLWLERYVALYPSHAQAAELLNSVISSLEAEGSRQAAASVAIPLEESPADLVEGTFATQTMSFDRDSVSDPFAAKIGLGAPEGDGFSFNTLGREQNDDVFATLEMPSFHDQHSADSARSMVDEPVGESTLASIQVAPEAPVVPATAAIPEVAEAAQTAPFGTLTGLDIETPAFEAEGLATQEWAAEPERAEGVSGRDVSDRLEDLFRDEPSATSPMLETFAPAPAAESKAVPVIEGVTGSDVSDRLEDLFRDEPSATFPMLETFNPAPAPAATVAAALQIEPEGLDLDSRMDALPDDLQEDDHRGVTGRDVEDRLDNIFPTSGLPEPSAVPPSSVAGIGSAHDDVVRGEDVDARLEELFGDDDLMATSAMERPSFPPMDDFEATIQLPTVPALPIEPENLVDPSSEGTITSSFEADILNADSATDSSADTRFELKDDPETLEEAVALGRETTAESMPVFQEPGSTMDLPALQEPDSWQPGSMLASRGSDVDSQLDELFASSSFPKEQGFPPMSPPAAAIVPPPSGPTELPSKEASSLAATSFEPKFHSEHAATTNFSRAEVTGEDINDRLDALFGTDSAFPEPAPVAAPSGVAGVPTVTLAEEYLRQGHRDQAESVYRELVALEPANPTYRTRLAEIQSLKNS